MVCARCGHFCHKWTWQSEWRASGEADPEWWSYAVDAQDDHLYWLRVCSPSCGANQRLEALCVAEHRAFAALVVLQPGDALPGGAVPGARVEELPPVLAAVLGGNLS